MNRHSVSAFFAMACISLVMMAIPVMGREVPRDVDAGRSPSLISIPWVAGNLGELKKALPDAKAVARFLEATFPEDFDEVPVVEYAFVDLGGDERLELLVTSGGNWINELTVVSRVGRALRHQDVDAYEIDDLPGSIVQLDTSGRKEVVVSGVLGSIARNGYPPVIPHVYRWNGTELVLADSQFPSYYSTVVLPDLQAQLRELDELNGSGNSSDQAETARHKDVLESEIAAVKRLIQ